MHIVSVDDLQSGMIAERDVHARGTTLITAGTVITEIQIGALKKWGVSAISIADENTGACDGDDPHRKDVERVEQLFSTVGNDKQMAILKTCYLRHISGG